MKAKMKSTHTQIYMQASPGLSRWAQCNHNGLWKKEEGGRITREENVVMEAEGQNQREMCYAAAFEDGGMDHKPWMQPIWYSEKQGKRFYPRVSGGNSAPPTLWFWPSDLQNCKIFGPLTCRTARFYVCVV